MGRLALHRLYPSLTCPRHRNTIMVWTYVMSKPLAVTNRSDINVLRDTILDSIADGVFTVDDQWRITSFNRAAERITGVKRG